MAEVVIVPRLELRLEADAVWRALAVPESAPRNPRAAARLQALWRDAMSLLEPRGAWRLIDGAQAVAAGMLDPPEAVAICVTTIGDGLETESRKSANAGALLDAVILDAIGSAAADAAADLLNREICAAARSKGLAAAPRESPGYGGWDVAWQPSLLALLPVADLGISLTAQGMMIPRKSVSFAVRLLDDDLGGATDRCARCGLTACRHRRETARRCDAGEGTRKEV